MYVQRVTILLVSNEHECVFSVLGLSRFLNEEYIHGIESIWAITPLRLLGEGIRIVKCAWALTVLYIVFFVSMRDRSSKFGENV